MAEVRRIKTAPKESHMRTTDGLQVHAFMVARAGTFGAAAV
jgi:hypothetical protein